MTIKVTKPSINLREKLNELQGMALSDKSINIPIQQFRITSDFSGNASNPQVLSANWEEVDSNMYGGNSSYVSQSNGEFSFSKPGVYLVRHTLTQYNGSGTAWDQYDSSIQWSDNEGVSYTSIARVFGVHAFVMNVTAMSHHVESVIKISNISNNKVRFVVGAENTVASGCTFQGDSAVTMTGAVFMRIGD